MNHYKMTVQYDGTRFSGWQRQGNTGNTIQYRLEKALTGLLGQEIQVVGSGRTDAGVHALGQVASFKTDRCLDCGETLRQLNEALPEDLAVTALSLASPRFHAMLSAREKTYRYTLNLGNAPDVFRRKYEYHLPGALDIPAMEVCARLMEGTHDFRGFSSGHTKKSTVRALRRIEFRQEGDKLYISFTGNGFLYNMVRILVGTLIEVGQGIRAPETVPEIFETLDRTKAGFTAPAQGLCLMEVFY